MAGVICNHCPIMCGLTGIETALTDAPYKLGDKLPCGIMRVTPDGEKDDVLEFCKANHKEAA